MNKDIKAFEELVAANPEIQEKLLSTAQNFDGDQTDLKAIFEKILLPVANESGLSATYEEFEEYLYGTGNESGKLSEDELEQVAGGKIKGLGLGLIACRGLGIGGGAAGSDEGGGVCALLGIGLGDALCLAVGEGDDE